MSTILAVDDSAIMRKCLEIAFDGTEFELISCADADEALARLGSASPSLVITDASLPPTDGYELCNSIKDHVPATPVLMLSSKQNPFDAAKGAQVDDHMEKPFDTQALQDRARQLIEAAPRAAAAQAAAASPAPVSVAAAPAPAAPAGKIPAPRRRRPTPAMMPNPLVSPRPVSPRPAAAARRTVPFAMPSPLRKTTPGMSPAQAEALRHGGPQPTMPMAGGVQQAAAAALGRAVVAAASPKAAEPAAPAAPAATAEDSLPPPTPQSALPEKLAALGLSKDQIEGVMALSREVIEEVVWEVVPTLAETLIKEELVRLTRP